MINSRALTDLDPVVRAKAEKFLAACSLASIDVLITSTYRDMESQTALYAQGRTAPGAKVTNAAAGYSAHNYRRAFDFVPMRAGKPVWGLSTEDKDLWNRLGSIGESVGLEWGGHWHGFVDFPHMQDLGGLTLEQYREGKRP